MKKRILILGAGMLQNFVIKKAKELNYEVHVLDMNPNSIGFQSADKYEVINIVDKDLCLKYAIENKIDGVLTAATDYGVLTASYIAEKLNLTGLKYSVAEIIKNKYEVRKKLFENQADDTKQFFEVKNSNDLLKIKEKIIFPVMLKPVDGSGSKGVTKVESKLELDKATKNALDMSISKKVLIESFFEGKEYGVESFVIDNQIYVLGIMNKEMTTPPIYAELGHSIPSQLPIDIEKKIVETVKNTIKALEINYGAVNMDLLVTKKNNVHIVDIGARMGGNLIGSHIIPLSTGIDYMANIIKAAVGDPVDFEKKYNKPVATKILALRPGIVKKIPNLKEMYTENTNDIICNLKENDQINEYKNNLDGCGYVVGVGNDIIDLIKEVSEIKEKINKNIIRENEK